VYYYRYVVLVLIAVSTLVGAALRSGLVAAFAQFGLADDRIAFLSTTSLVSLVVAVGLLVAGLRYVPFLTFLDEVIAELGRVTWPTRQEAVRAAGTVVVTAGFLAVVISIYDLVWKNLANLILYNQS
jgi:preprotein translocase SecE subunit